VPDVPNGHNITIRQLAAMRSGLYDYSEVVVPALPSQPHCRWTPEELLEIGFSQPPLFAPGAEFDYSNTNTALLGLVIETVSGQPLYAYIEEHIARPWDTSTPGSSRCGVAVAARLGLHENARRQDGGRDRLGPVVGIRCGKHDFNA
jgi:CubicO group peptidase (beta-lactamase class C family)